MQLANSSSLRSPDRGSTAVGTAAKIGAGVGLGMMALGALTRVFGSKRDSEGGGSLIVFGAVLMFASSAAHRATGQR